MLWYKAWLETRFRFVISAALIIAGTSFFVFGNPFILETWRTWEKQHPTIPEQEWILRASVDYSYFIWHFVFRTMLQQLWVMVAVLIGLGGLSREVSQGTVAFTLSLPVTRVRMASVRGAVGLLEATVLGLIPAVLVPTFSPFVGQSYSIIQGLAHCFLMVLGGIVFYCFSQFLSTVIRNESVPTLVAVAFVILFYFIFAPYVEDTIAEPAWLQVFDLSRVMASVSHVSSLYSISLQAVALSFFTGLGIFYASLKLTEKQDF
jgi:ABC-2 type transport system permease protein